MKTRRHEYHYITPVRSRWRTQVDSEHIGMFDTMRDAAIAADAYIIGHLEKLEPRNTGKWELNFPDKILPLDVRFLLNVCQNTELMNRYYEHGHGPQIYDFIEQPENTNDEKIMTDYFERLYFADHMSYNHRIMKMVFPKGMNQYVTLARDMGWDCEALGVYFDAVYRTKETWPD